MYPLSVGAPMSRITFWLDIPIFILLKGELAGILANSFSVDRAVGVVEAQPVRISARKHTANICLIFFIKFPN
jgi:hypothetical protein